GLHLRTGRGGRCATLAAAARGACRIHHRRYDPSATAKKPSSTILELLNRPIPFPAMAITTCLRALGWL
ncbi:hypothetical protein ACRCPT_34770, partial [Pseudomonas aeruginosa]